MFDVFYVGPKPNLFPYEQWAATLEEAKKLSRTRFFWYINGLNDYLNFNFDYRPPPWEAEFTHVWPSQWQENGGTLLVPKNSIELKWHWHKEIVPRKTSAPIFYIDFRNEESDAQFLKLQNSNKNIKRIRYVGSHLDVLKRIVHQTSSEYIWIVSSICDYTNFDFTWHPSQWQADMLHCFSWTNSDMYKRGDTFYLHVESYKKQMYDLELLDWFNVIHYNAEQVVHYLPCPKIVYEGDNLVEVIKNYTFTFPYAQFFKKGLSDNLWNESMCLWTEKNRQIVSYSADNSNCLVPKDIKQYLDTQLYDYPHIKDDNLVQLRCKPLDVIFISNGEPDAEKWFDHLRYTLSQRDPDWVNKLKRVQNVNGRDQAYKAAAKLSESDWFFAVFAKLEVVSDFNWEWQPDYWQIPKHYIFHAKNPVNGLVYGHQAVIAYNKRLVLETTNSTLDFTLSQSHNVIPVISGIAHYNQDAWTTWRTAFREVLKLRYFQSHTPTVETEYRIKKWCTVAEGNYAEWSILGSQDAIEYYNQINGEYNKLKLSYEWDWLKQYAITVKNYNF